MVLRAALVVLAHVVAITAQVPQYGQEYGLDGTYYGVQSPYGQGHCSFQFADSYNLPWTSGVTVPLALNGPQYADSTPCGMCIQYRGTGDGSGLVPIQTDEWKFGIVSDECPECLAGSLDLATDGDGRWKIEWIPVQCNVGTSTFVYSLQGSNNYYVKLNIANTRVPVAAVSLNGVPMSKTIDNYWLTTASQSPGIVFPLPITITSLLGDTVTDVVPASLSFPSGSATGAAQFPINCSVASVQPGGTLPLSGPATSSGGAEACATTSTSPPAVASSPPPQASPPPPQLPPPPMPQASAVPSPPPSVPVPQASPVPSPPPPVTATPAATNASAAVPQIASPAPESCNRTVPLGNQCGGEGGQCAIQGRDLDLDNCEDDQWIGTCCPSGSFCRRLQRFIWQCASLDAAGTTYPVQQGPIPSLSQCGGVGTCPNNLCADKQWANTSCTTGNVCTRYDRNYWQCRPLPFSKPAPPVTYIPNPIPVAG